MVLLRLMPPFRWPPFCAEVEAPPNLLFGLLLAARWADLVDQEGEEDLGFAVSGGYTEPVLCLGLGGADR